MRPPAVARVAKRITPIWVAGVIVGSFLPGEWKRRLGIQPYIRHHLIAPQHRLVHMITFAITALLFLLLTDRPKDEVRAAGAVLLLGCGIEVMQFAIRFAPVFEWWDVRDDAIGIVIVLVAFKAFTWC
jgi:hypothetical protein